MKNCDNCKYKTEYVSIKVTYYCGNKNCKNHRRITKYIQNKDCPNWEAKGVKNAKS